MKPTKNYTSFLFEGVSQSTDNLYTTQTPECSKGKYNVKIINESLSEGLTNNLCRPKARNKKEANGINGYNNKSEKPMI
jgi:hypothetical protein